MAVTHGPRCSILIGKPLENGPEVGTGPRIDPLMRIRGGTCDGGASKPPMMPAARMKPDTQALFRPPGAPPPSGGAVLYLATPHGRFTAVG